MRTPVSQRFADFMTLAQARGVFFAASNLGDDGGYNNRWVRIESKPIPVFFPNFAGRVAAAKLHDLHHIATEYAVDWTGEAEIAGWEIAGGCGRYGWAWLLNLGAFTVGLVLSPKALFRAFIRGRHARTNLYHSGFADAALPQVTVGELRRQLGTLDPLPTATAADKFAFAAWAVIGLAWHALAGIAGLGCLWLLLHAAGVI